MATFKSKLLNYGVVTAHAKWEFIGILGQVSCELTSKYMGFNGLQPANTWNSIGNYRKISNKICFGQPPISIFPVRRGPLRRRRVSARLYRAMCGRGRY